MFKLTQRMIGGRIYPVAEVDSMLESEFLEVCANILWRRGGVVGVETMQNEYRRVILLALQNDVIVPGDKVSKEISDLVHGCIRSVHQYHLDFDGDVYARKSISDFVAMHMCVLGFVRGDYMGDIPMEQRRNLCINLHNIHQGNVDVIWYLPLRDVGGIPDVCAWNLVSWTKQSRVGFAKRGCEYSMMVHYTKILDVHNCCGVFACVLGGVLSVEEMQLVFDAYDLDVWLECSVNSIVETRWIN